MQAGRIAMAGSVVLVVGVAACSSPAEDEGQLYHCGAQDIRVWQQNDDRLQLQRAGQSYELQRVESESGDAYHSADDAEYSIAFWAHGDTALLEVNSQSFPECSKPGAILQPFVARGNEPFWLLEVEGERLTWRAMGEDDRQYSISKQRDEDAQKTVIQSEQVDLTVEVTERLCQDSMSGMYYPQSVQVDYDGERFDGCGGMPGRLLHGTDWQVTQLNDTDLSDYEVTVRFASDGNISGRAACNRYFGRYELSGEGIQVSGLAGTKMACERDKMEVEYDFLAVLDDIYLFAVNRADERADHIQLRTSDDRKIQLEQR